MSFKVPSGRGAHLLGGLGLVALVGFAYVPAYKAGFLWDDIEIYILDNPLLRSLDGLRAIWFSGEFLDYYPLTLTAFWLEWQAWGENPMGYHIVAVILHTLSSLLLWNLLARLRVPGAWLAAAFFALHPVNVESVAWISQQKNTVSGVFFFAALIAHLRFQSEERRLWYVVGVICFALAILAKPSVVALPLVILGIAWWKRGHLGKRDLLGILPHAVLALAAAAIALSFQGNLTADADIYEGSALSRFAVAGRAVWFYLQKALLPFHLSLVYPRWSVTDLGWVSFVPAALCVLTTLLLWWLRKRARGPLFAWGCFLLLLAPVLGFVDIGYMQFSLVADHWQYFSLPVVLASLVALLARGLDRLRVESALRIVLGAATLVLLFFLTREHAAVFASEEVAWRKTLQDNPSAWNAHSRLGNVLRQSGRLQESASHYLQAVQLNPNYGPGHQVLGTLFAQMGDFERAEAHFERSLQLQPGSADAHANYGHYLIARRRYGEATQHLRTALTLQPENPRTLADLAHAMQSQGDPRSAVQNYEHSLRLQEDPDVGFNLGMLHSQLGQHEQAAQVFVRVLQLAPQDVQARLMLADQYRALGRIPEAVLTLNEARQRAQGNPRLQNQIDERLQQLRETGP